MIAHEQPCEHTNLMVDVSADEIIAAFNAAHVKLTDEMVWHITVTSTALQIAFKRQHEGRC